MVRAALAEEFPPPLRGEYDEINVIPGWSGPDWRMGLLSGQPSGLRRRHSIVQESMMEAKFCIQSQGASFLFRRVGENSEVRFKSLREAIKYAQALPQAKGTRAVPKMM